MSAIRNLAILTLFAYAFPLLILQVNADIISVPGDFNTIQEAIDAASEGDIVELGVGVFRGHGNRDIRLHGKAITIRGAFGAEFSMVDAEGTSEEPYRGFIFDSGETTDTVIEGLTICGGATLLGAIADQFNGGGLFFRESSPTIKNCIIDGNQCGCWGAGVYVSFEASPVLINCDISHNVADDDGGAVFAWNGGNVTLINCNLSDNVAAVTGGAIAGFGGSGQVTVINSTMANNQAPWGSAIVGSDVTVINSIIWGNTGGQVIYQNWSEITNSIVQGGYEGIGNLDADPLFVDASRSDYRLNPGSPAIDAADNTALPVEAVTDLDGNFRFHDDTGTVDTGIAGDQDAVSDLGPFEFHGTTYRFSKANFGN